jgi:hypothetical protein
MRLFLNSFAIWILALASGVFWAYVSANPAIQTAELIIH